MQEVEHRAHDLVRLYARERAVLTHPEPERSAALARTIGDYTATAWRTLALLRPGDRRTATADPRWTSACFRRGVVRALRVDVLRSRLVEQMHVRPGERGSTWAAGPARGR